MWISIDGRMNTAWRPIDDLGRFVPANWLPTMTDDDLALFIAELESISRNRFGDVDPQYDVAAEGRFIALPVPDDVLRQFFASDPRWYLDELSRMDVRWALDVRDVLSDLVDAEEERRNTK